LTFFPDPHGQRSFTPTFGVGRTNGLHVAGIEKKLDNLDILNLLVPPIRAARLSQNHQI